MTLKKVNAICSSTIKVFTKSKDKVSSKFLTDAVKSIIVSRSLNLSKLSRAVVPDSKGKNFFKKSETAMQNTEKV